MKASEMTFSQMYAVLKSGKATNEQLKDFKIEAWFRSTTTPDASAELLHAIDAACGGA